MLEIFKKHLADFAAGNWTEYKAALAPDAIYDELPTRQRVSGPDECVKVVQRWKKAFPDSRATIITSFESANDVVLEVEWQGTQSAALEGPFGTIPASNRRATVRAVIVGRIKNGKIAEMRHYFDLLTLLTQIGVAPVAGAQPGVQTVTVPPARH